MILLLQANLLLLPVPNNIEDLIRRGGGDEKREVISMDRPFSAVAAALQFSFLDFFVDEKRGGMNYGLLNEQ